MQPNNPMQLDDKLPPIVYKYRKWDFPDGFDHCILTVPSIYFSSPQNFNDPFDSKLPLGYHSKTDEEILGHLIKNHPNEIDKIASLTKDLMKDRKGRIEQIEQNRLNSIIVGSGVFCLSSRPDNLLLWSHYADYHKGFCVGIDSSWLDELVFQSVERNQDIFCVPLKVKYVEEFPELNPLYDDDESDMQFEWLKQTYRYKSKDWYYEEEYRIVLSHATDKLLENLRIQAIPKTAIKEVRLGCQIPENAKVEVINKISMLAPSKHIQLFQAHKQENEFALGFERLTY